VTDVVVTFVSVPQPFPEQLLPVAVQVTPRLRLSLARNAVKFIDWPESMVCAALGLISTVMDAPPPPHPAIKKAPRQAKMRAAGNRDLFMRPPEVASYLLHFGPAQAGVRDFPVGPSAQAAKQFE
jgi:hypothetical protein